jgi:hypothetical protein
VAVLTLAYDAAAKLVAAEDDVAVIVVLELLKILVADVVILKSSKDVVAVNVGNEETEAVTLRPSMEDGEPHVPFPLLI